MGNPLSNHGVGQQEFGSSPHRLQAAQHRMAPARLISARDPGEDSQARLGLGFEAAPVAQLAWLAVAIAKVSRRHSARYGGLDLGITIP